MIEIKVEDQFKVAREYRNLEFDLEAAFTRSVSSPDLVFLLIPASIEDANLTRGAGQIGRARQCQHVDAGDL
ncbi:MAG: hypothetical protein AB1490_00835 [Pseudomonadota bacterium]